MPPEDLNPTLENGTGNGGNRSPSQDSASSSGTTLISNDNFDEDSRCPGVCCVKYPSQQPAPSTFDDRKNIWHHLRFPYPEDVDEQGNVFGLDQMIEPLLTIWKIRLWKEKGYWENRSNAILYDIKLKLREMREIALNRLQTGDWRTKRVQARRVRQAATSGYFIRTSSADDIEGFLRNVLNELEHELETC